MGRRRFLDVEFQDGHIRVLRCMYEDEEIDAEVIREKLRTAYGAPWKEFAWQEGRNEWRSEERMIDRLDEKTAQEIRVELEALTAIPNMNRFDSLYRLYEELCERYLVTLSFYEEEKTLEWNPYRYTMVAKYSEEKTSGKVPFAELLALSEGGQEMMAEDGCCRRSGYPVMKRAWRNIRKNWDRPASASWLLTCRREVYFGCRRNRYITASRKRLSENIILVWRSIRISRMSPIG